MKYSFGFRTLTKILLLLTCHVLDHH